MQPEIKDKLDHYHALLLKWQKTINLISSKTMDDAWDRHFVDSLQILNYLPQNPMTLCDIGSGAGFPGLVIAIARPDLNIHLVESDVRKCAFLSNVSRETLCRNVTIHNNRIEDILPDLSVDYVTARALAPLNDLINYTRIQWENNINFQMVLLKGRHYQNEIQDAENNFTFDIGEYPSRTESDARILSVSNIIIKSL